MMRSIFRRDDQFRSGSTKVAVALAVYAAVCLARADQVHMQNGDNYYGKVLSLNADTLALQSDVLGTVHLPRSKVAAVTFGVTAKPTPALRTIQTNQLPQGPALSVSNSPSEISAAFRQLGANSNLLQLVQAQFLGDAGPEANNKFNQLLGGLISGKLNLNDIRAEAKSATDQVRALRKDLGDDAGPLIDGYLAILDGFLKETAPSAAALTNTAPAAPKSKPTPAEED